MKDARLLDISTEELATRLPALARTSLGATIREVGPGRWSGCLRHGRLVHRVRMTVSSEHGGTRLAVEVSARRSFPSLVLLTLFGAVSLYFLWMMAVMVGYQRAPQIAPLPTLPIVLPESWGWILPFAFIATGIAAPLLFARLMRTSRPETVAMLEPIEKLLDAAQHLTTQRVSTFRIAPHVRARIATSDEALQVTEQCAEADADAHTDEADALAPFARARRHFR